MADETTTDVRPACRRCSEVGYACAPNNDVIACPGEVCATCDYRAGDLEYEQERRTQEPHACGHAERTDGCGGCDPGAVEYVRDDGGPWRRVPDHERGEACYPRVDNCPDHAQPCKPPVQHGDDGGAV